MTTYSLSLNLTRVFCKLHTSVLPITHVQFGIYSRQNIDFCTPENAILRFKTHIFTTKTGLAAIYNTHYQAITNTTKIIEILYRSTARRFWRNFQRVTKKQKESKMATILTFCQKSLLLFKIYNYLPNKLPPCLYRP